MAHAHRVRLLTGRRDPRDVNGVRVGEVEPAAGVPRRALVAVGGETAVVLQHQRGRLTFANHAMAGMFARCEGYSERWKKAAAARAHTEALALAYRRDAIRAYRGRRTGDAPLMRANESSGPTWRGCSDAVSSPSTSSGPSSSSLPLCSQSRQFTSTTETGRAVTLLGKLFSGSGRGEA